MGNRILDMISRPQDLRVLSDDELAILCDEIRAEIIDVTSRNGGHLASSLGAVEIIVALHSLLDCPHDRIVFDVGHQAYAHKLLTGRLDRFGTLRTAGGITGFPNPAESPYDVHPAGHASDSLSVAMGLARARELTGQDFRIVSVIGDASLAGGMAFEALNHIGQEQTPMVIVLNDNGMSISRPVGALVRHLGSLRTMPAYRAGREAVQEAMEDAGPISRAALDLGRNWKESIKQFVIPHSMLFEQLGIVCTAPVDGHDIALLRQELAVALRADAPVLVHVVTQKGHGFAPAERNPTMFHGLGPFDPETGAPVRKQGAKRTYTSVFGQAMLAEAERDPSIVAITAAMADGTGLAPFAERFPGRFIDTGITEEHAVALASGLAAGGAKPVVAIYSTFLQRAVDQIVIDNALADRNVVFAVDRAGLVGDDGPTHHGTLDLSYLRMVPGMRVLAPSDEAELASALHTALALPGPVALRYPRGEGAGAEVPEHPETWTEGESREVRAGDDVALLAWGRMVGVAAQAAELLERKGVSARVVDMRWAKPIDGKAVARAAGCKLVAALEEGVRAGGCGQGVLDLLSQQGADVPAVLFTLPDEFVEQGSVELLFERLGLDARSVARTVLARLDGAAL